ncbi:hypothetical protein [Salinibacillus xinjiangensis]|uniref:Uncharacterized protein n=1 Tax=Salinibacillus xinjiangensis TaxID=1229268 RepID=A0A6G1XA63_9BACI|nr:hypothetical protein [Salinibacillus xinjiangensis]MRG87832.1 hypothetical protein [Salinibacillus xinjiangensis]
MEQSQMNQILEALKQHSQKMDEKLTDIENRMDAKFDKVEKRFDRLEKKVDGMRVEFNETQENVNFLTSKYVEHDRKIRELSNKR